MNIEIRVGNKQDIEAIEQLYDGLNDYLEVTVNYPGWKKGIYPTREDAEKGIVEGTLFVVNDGEEIIGSMILRYDQEWAFISEPWQKQLEYSQVLGIYTFVVKPSRLHKGIGSLMLKFAEEYARGKDIKALRLDVYEENLPAIKLYEKSGFRYISTVSLGLEEYGLNWFKLYEKLI